MRHPATLALIVVAVLFVGAQLVLMDASRAFSWDEAIYLSQVRPDSPALGFAVHRARGITWMVAPVAAHSAGTTPVRVYLAVVSGPALWAGFLPWVRTAGWAAPVAAFLYASTWFVLASHVEVQPNPMAALAVVAAAGWFVRTISDPGRSRDLIALALAVAVVAVLRPTESVLLCLGLLPALAGIARTRSARAIGAMLVGGLVGFIPWLIEAFDRFGGPVERTVQLTEATTQTAPAAPAWEQYLSLMDTWLAGPVTDPDISAVAIGWVGALVVGCGAGWIVNRWAGRERMAVTLTSASLALLLPYLLFNPYAHLRFLFPAYGVALVLVAIGMVSGTRRLRLGGRAARVMGHVLLIGAASAWVMLQGALTVEVGEDLRADREPARSVGEHVAHTARGQPCAVASEQDWPQIAFYAQCRGGPIFLDHSVPKHFADAPQPYRVYAVATSIAPGDSQLGGWESEPITGMPGWILHRRPERT